MTESPEIDDTPDEHSPERPPKPTAGSVALAAKFARHGDMARHAREMDVKPQLMSRWASGDRMPPLHRLLEIEERFGIPVKDWTIAVETGVPGAA